MGVGLNWPWCPGLNCRRALRSSATQASSLKARLSAIEKDSDAAPRPRLATGHFRIRACLLFSQPSALCLFIIPSSW